MSTFRPALALLFALAVPVFQADAAALPAEQLLEYFSATCRSQGSWTKVALGKASALVQTLKSVANAPECRSLSGTVAQLTLLENRLSQVSSISAEDARMAENRRLEQELLFQLSQTQDAMEVANLRMQLSEVQLEFVTLDARKQARKSLNSEEQAKMMSEIASYTEAVLQQAAVSQECLIKTPGLLPGIASLAGSVASSVTAVNPGLSVGIASGTQILSSILDTARKWGLSRKIRKANDPLEIAAMSCVLESFVSDYCEAEDALTAVDWKLKNSRASVNPPRSSLRATIRLIERESPAILAWLESLRAGALVSTTADGARVKDFFEQEASLRGALPLTRGLFNEKKAQLLAARTEEQRWNALRGLLLGWLSVITNSSSSFGGDTSNPLFRVYPPTVGLYYLVGIPQNLIPLDDSGRPLEFSAFNALIQWPGEAEKLTYDLDIIYSRLVLWSSDAQLLLAAERERIVNPDILNTLTSCYDTEFDERKVSPCQAVTALREYFDFRLESPKLSNQLKRIYRETRDRLIRIETAVSVLKQSRDPSLNDLSNVLGAIYLESNLDYGIYFLKGRFDTLLKQSFVELFMNASPEDQAMAAEALAADRFMEALYRVKNDSSIINIRRDIKKSTALNQTSLDGFVLTFGKEIANVLEILQKKERSLGAASGQSFRDERTEICLNLLNASTWPKAVSPALCTGLELELVPGGPRSPKIDLALIQSPHPERACKLPDLLRKTYIHRGRQ